MRPFLFRGYHKTGKTTLMEAAIKGLIGHGHAVAAVKHSPHLHLASSDSTDSGLFFNAGCRETALIAADGSLLFRRSEGGTADIEEIISGFRTDFILIEGFKSYGGDIPNLVFGRNGGEYRRLIIPSTVGCSGWFLTDPAAREDLAETGLPLLPADTAGEEIAAFIEEHTSP